MENKTQKLGGAWKRTSPKSGTSYYQGNIKLDKDYKQGDVIFFNIFKNVKKQKENSPDLNILKSNYEKKANGNQNLSVKDDDIIF